MQSKKLVISTSLGSDCKPGFFSDIKPNIKSEGKIKLQLHGPHLIDELSELNLHQILRHYNPYQKKKWS